jgi:hypothetical protein
VSSVALSLYKTRDLRQAKQCRFSFCVHKSLCYVTWWKNRARKIALDFSKGKVRCTYVHEFRSEMFKQFLPVAALLLTGILTGCPQTIEKPSIVSFVATPATLPVGGGTSKLSWDVKGAETISIDQNVGAVTGMSKDITVQTTTTYTLTAKNSGGESTTTTKVTVDVPPVVTNKVITSAISSWTRGAREVRVLNYTSSSPTPSVLAKGKISADGNLDVKLPADIDGLTEIELLEGCIDQTLITATPKTAKVVSGYVAFEVYNDLNKRIGTLAKTNSAGKTSYFSYIDRDAMIKGLCKYSQSGSAQAIDVQMKKGWNEIVSNTSTSPSKSSTEAPTADMIWKFELDRGTTLELTSPSEKLEFGSSLTLDAKAFDVEGNPIPASKIKWQSDNPELASVDESGVVTATSKNLDWFNNSVSITASVDGESYAGKSVNLRLYGLMVKGGTLNVDDQKLGVVGLLKYVMLDGTVANQEFDYTVTGPSGWNNNQSVTARYKPNSTSSSYGLSLKQFFVSEVTALNGTYKVHVETPIQLSANTVAAQARTAALFPTKIQYPSGEIQSSTLVAARTQQSNGGSTFTVDTSKKQEKPQGLRLTDITSQSNGSYKVAARWNYDYYVSNYYFAQIINSVDETILNEITVASTDGIMFENVLLESGKSYKLRVYGYSSAYSNNMAKAEILLDLRPQIQSLSSQGGSVNGGYPIEIKGIGFNIDTTVRFGAAVISSAALVDSYTLRVNAPAGTVGEVDVTVTNANGTSSSSAVTKFKYYENQEYSATAPTQLLQGLNGDIYYTDLVYANFTNSVKLVKITDAGVSSSIDIPAQTNNPNDMVLDSGGNVWMLFNQTVVKVSPTGVLTTLSIPSSISAGVIAVGSDGNIWIGHANESKISRFDQSGSNLSSFTLPVSNCCSSTGFYYSSDMVLGADNNLWFTNGSYLGRVKPDGSIILLPNNSSSISGKLTLIGSDLWASSGFGGVSKIAMDGTITNVTLQCGAPRVALSKDGFYWCSQGYYYSSSFGMVRSNADGSIKQQIALPSNPNQSSSISDFVDSTTGKMWYISNNKVGYIQP